jgi:diadenylate cyclase
MPQTPESLQTFFDTLRRASVLSVIDILLIAIVIYAALVWLKGASGMSMVKGAAVIVVGGVALAGLLGNQLHTVDWVLRNSLPALLVAVPIVFQPEIRRALERLGRSRVAARRHRRASAPVLTTLSEAAIDLSARRLGALIVIERETGLDDFIRSGAIVDAVPTKDLLINIFWRNSPLHDGAVIVRDNRVAAARCILPPSEALMPGHLGTRHRAALGISEQTDAVVIVVSEETGAISIAFNGQLLPGLGADRLRSVLQQHAGQVEGATLRLIRPGDAGGSLQQGGSSGGVG